MLKSRFQKATVKNYGELISHKEQLILELKQVLDDLEFERVNKIMHEIGKFNLRKRKEK